MSVSSTRAASVAIISLAAALAAGQSASFTQLFNGTFDGWTIENTEQENFHIVDGVLEAAAPAGWLKSAREYANVELEIEFRFMTDDADSGIFFRAAGNRPFGPGWPNQSYQVQLRNPIGDSPFPPVGAIFRHGMPPGETNYDETLARTTSRPTGEWQKLFIRVVGSDLIVELNDIHITTATGIGNASGYIGIQGETGAVQYREIAIREL